MRPFTVVPLLEKRRNRNKTLTAKEIFEKKESNTHKLKGFEFLGKVPRKFSILIFGVPGSGKSTFCLKLAQKISKSRRTFYACSEEAHNSESIEERIKLNGITSGNIFLREISSPLEIIPAVKELFCSNVIIDSISYLKIGEQKMKNIRDSVSGISIFISHSTKAGSHRGVMSIEHLIDISIMVTDKKIAQVRKNRFGDMCSYDVLQGINYDANGDQII